MAFQAPRRCGVLFPPFTVPRQLQPEQLAEGGDGDHYYGNAALSFSPEEEPDAVGDAVADLRKGDADQSEDDHDGAEAQDDTETNFALEGHVHVPKEGDRYGYNKNIGKDVENGSQVEVGLFSSFKGYRRADGW